MSQFLLDTNVISELRKASPHGAVLKWYRTLSIDRLVLPAISFYEMQAGVEATRRQDPLKAVEIERWIDDLPNTMHVISFSTESARETARLMRGISTDHLEDAMIAAVARVNRYTVATRNVKDFRLFQVAVVNPFDFEG